MFVAQQIMIHSPQAYSAISKMYKIRGNYQHTEKKSAFTRKHMDSYLKFGFIQCPDNDQLPRPQCVICATILGNEATKPSRLIRHLNTKHSALVNKPTEFFMHKRDAFKMEKKIISQASTTDTSLLTASYLISLQIAKCKKPYSIGEKLIKPFNFTVSPCIFQFNNV